MYMEISEILHPTHFQGLLDDVAKEVNVNVNLYSASSQKAPLLRSMCRVLIKKTRLQCTTKIVNLHVRFMQIVFEQVPCCWSSDSEGATAVRIELKPWNDKLLMQQYSLKIVFRNIPDFSVNFH